MTEFGTCSDGKQFGTGTRVLPVCVVWPSGRPVFLPVTLVMPAPARGKSDDKSTLFTVMPAVVLLLMPAAEFAPACEEPLSRSHV